MDFPIFSMVWIFPVRFFVNVYRRVTMGVDTSPGNTWPAWPQDDVGWDDSVILPSGELT